MRDTGKEEGETMKNVLIAIQNLGNGGAEKSLVNLLNELPKEKYHVDLLLFRQTGMFLQQVPPWVTVLPEQPDVKKLYSPIKKAGNLAFVKIWGTLVSRVKEKEPHRRAAYRWIHFYGKHIKQLDKHYDVAFAYTSSEIMFFVDEKVQADKKYVWIHNDYVTGRHPKKYDKPYFERMNGIVSISEKCVSILKEEFPEFAQKILYIENITSSSVVRQRANEFMPQEFAENVPNLVSVGRLTQQKGFDMAVEAAALMKKDGYRFVWYIIGNGELEEPLRRQIKERHVEDCFRLLGVRENPYPYIKHCTIFAQTSRWEGKSVVIDEAKILAKPLVVTDYATVHDQVSQEVEGLIVPMHAQGIAKGLERMLDDHDLRSRIEDHLQAHEYGNQSEVMKYMKLFDE